MKRIWTNVSDFQFVWCIIVPESLLRVIQMRKRYGIWRYENSMNGFLFSYKTF